MPKVAKRNAEQNTPGQAAGQRKRKRARQQAQKREKQVSFILPIRNRHTFGSTRIGRRFRMGYTQGGNILKSGREVSSPFRNGRPSRMTVRVRKGLSLQLLDFIRIRAIKLLLGQRIMERPTARYN